MNLPFIGTQTNPNFLAQKYAGCTLKLHLFILLICIRLRCLLLRPSPHSLTQTTRNTAESYSSGKQCNGKLVSERLLY